MRQVEAAGSLSAKTYSFISSAKIFSSPSASINSNSSRSKWIRSAVSRSEEHTSELQSQFHLVCRLLLETAPTELYTLSLHDALPIFRVESHEKAVSRVVGVDAAGRSRRLAERQNVLLHLVGKDFLVAIGVDQLE